jgi:hypothetical protein
MRLARRDIHLLSVELLTNSLYLRDVWARQEVGAFLICEDDL